MIIGLDVKSKKMNCSQCAKEVKSKYFRLDQYDKVICQGCYSKSHKCQVCGLPSKEVFLYKEHKICGDCFSKQYRCKSCCKDLKGEDVQYIYGIQGFFCSSCMRLKNKCSRCSLPAYADDILQKVDQGINLCNICLSTSVMDEEIAKKVLINISMILYKKMDLQLVKGLSLNLLNRKELLKIYQESFLDADPPESEILGFTKREGKNYKIYVATGLPLSTFISTMTHEYARAWQLRYCSKQIGRILWEGFTEWTATKILWLLGYHDEILKIEGFGQQQGFGLKKIQVIEKSKGTQGVLDFMTQMR